MPTFVILIYDIGLRNRLRGSEAAGELAPYIEIMLSIYESLSGNDLLNSRSLSN
jgi:hypothetical protein